MAPAYKRYFVHNATVFLTLVTAGRQYVFGEPARVKSAFETLKKVRSIHPFKMKAWVMMPDHLHLLIHVVDGHFDRIVQSFKRNVSLEFHRLNIWEGEVWQKRFYDHVIRNDEDFGNHLDYIHFNPVHHGLAHRPADYAFSSFDHYIRSGWYDPNWGKTIPNHIKHMKLE